MRRVFLILILVVFAYGVPGAQSVSQKQQAFEIEHELGRLPTYGVFDFIAFGHERGKVTLVGYAYQGGLKSHAARAVRRVSGVDEVDNKIELLPASQNDDRIRWATFYNIYTDSFLSRYSPGGEMSARYESVSVAPVPGDAAVRHVSDSHHREERPDDADGRCRQPDGQADGRSPRA